MQDMRQLEGMGLMDPSEIEKFQKVIDESEPGEELANIKRLIDPVKDEEGLRSIAQQLNKQFSQVQIPKHLKEPLPKNKVKRARARSGLTAKQNSLLKQVEKDLS